MQPTFTFRFPLVLGAGLVLTACSSLQVPPVSNGHILAEKQPATNVDIPKPVAATTSLQRPKAAVKTESYSVSVRNVAVQELLFALARDAKLNVDIHPGIVGVVTINAIDQTLQQILTRISKQVDMRWELDGPNLAVMPDSPYLRTYRVDYVNMSRDVTGAVTINTQIASTSSGTTGGSGVGGNSSATSVKSEAKNHFWEALDKNLKDILRETDKVLPEGSSETTVEKTETTSTTGFGALAQAVGAAANNKNTKTSATNSGGPTTAETDNTNATTVKRTTYREAASVITNAEAGVVVVRASSRQHEKIQEFLDLVLTNARRQVIIEATIAEVILSDRYQQGINWQSLRTLRPGASTAGFSVAQNQSGLVAGAVPNPFESITAAGTFSFLLNYVAPGLGISSTLSLLETFGKVKVLSSPKVSVLNNQTAMLRVVDNLVYFEMKTDPATTVNGVTTPAVTTGTARSVAVGVVMSVTPQISESGTILLNVRPTITSRKDCATCGVTDPTPGLAVPNIIPEIQMREMESMLRLADGEVAVMGGLMEDRVNSSTNQIPGLGNIPGIGNFFKNRDETNTKTELVVFLKPTIIRTPSMHGDYKDFSSYLPGKDFMQRSNGEMSSGMGASRP